MRYVVVYDVTDDKRRRRLFRRLRQLLEPVQKSVFEGELGARGLAAVETAVRSTLDLDEDQVRVYALCVGCRGLTRTYGVIRVVPDPAAPIVM